MIGYESATFFCLIAGGPCNISATLTATRYLSRQSQQSAMSYQEGDISRAGTVLCTIHCKYLRSRFIHIFYVSKQ